MVIVFVEIDLWELYQKSNSERMAYLGPLLDLCESMGVVPVDKGTWSMHFCGTLDHYYRLHKAGYKVSLGPEVNTGEVLQSSEAKFQSLCSKMEALLTKTWPSSPEYNTVCEVHMPGQALSTYNDVMLLEDACTDALQTAMDIGWRIISACPQPNQRRPDYILGRFNPKKQEATGYAKRERNLNEA